MLYGLSARLPVGWAGLTERISYFPVSASLEGEKAAVSEWRENASGFNHAAGRRRRWAVIAGGIIGYGVSGKSNGKPLPWVGLLIT